MICPVCHEEHIKIEEVKTCFDKLARIVGNQYLVDGVINNEYKRICKRLKEYIAGLKK